MLDVIIVGAGIAGLAAGHALLEDELDVLVLEARDRLGGRVHTDRFFAGFPVEFGADFVYGERAATWRWIDRLGLATSEWTNLDDSWVRLASGQRLSMRAALEAAEATDSVELLGGLDLARSLTPPPTEPRPLESFADYLRRVGFGPSLIEQVSRTFATAEGENLRFLDATATLASLHAREFDGAEIHLIREGHGALIEALGVGQVIHTGAVVTTVTWSEEGVAVRCANGAAYEARSAIVTLPLGVLQSGDVTFDPPLPDAKVRALSGLGMGPAAKFLYRFAEPLTPPQISAIYAAGNPPMWWSPSAFRDSNQAVIWSALASGEGLVELMSHGEGEALERALEALRLEAGRPGLRALDARVIDWYADPFSRGGLSHVRPGHQGARELLAEPTPPLYWAGEATSPEERAATVQGALLSGERAAVELRSWLQRPPGPPAAAAASPQQEREQA